MFEKIDVNGPDEHPLYTYLKDSAPGILGSKRIKWNFTKFLVNEEGKVIKRFGPNVKPEDIETLDLLKDFYPTSVMRLYESQVDGRDFYMISVPPAE